MQENWAEIQMNNTLVLHGDVEKKITIDNNELGIIETLLEELTEIEWIKSENIYIPKIMESELEFPIHLKRINLPSKIHTTFLIYDKFLVYPKESGLKSDYKLPIESYYNVRFLQSPGFECTSQILSPSDLKLLIYKIKRGDYILRKL